MVPLGATEQHGPHLPTGTDYFTVESLAREAAAIASRRVPVIVTPALPFGSSDHHFVFGGTLSLSTETYYRVVRELVESLVTDGFTRIFLVNGHGGNHELAQLVARDVALKRPVRVAAGSYWTIAWDALVNAEAHRGRRLPGHAGDFETSIVLSLRPELVSEISSASRRNRRLRSAWIRGAVAERKARLVERDRRIYRQSGSRLPRRRETLPLSSGTGGGRGVGAVLRFLRSLVVALEMAEDRVDDQNRVRKV